MTQQFNATVNLTTEGCCVCGVVFTIPCALRKRLLESHEYFYCPNGHSQRFAGETEEQKRIEQLEGAFDEMEVMYQQEKEENQKAKNKIAYLKRKEKK